MPSHSSLIEISVLCVCVCVGKNCSYTSNRLRAPLVFGTDREQTVYTVYCIVSVCDINLAVICVFSLLEREDFSIFRPCAICRKFCSISITQILKRLRFGIFFVCLYVFLVAFCWHCFIYSLHLVILHQFWPFLLSRFTVCTNAMKMCTMSHKENQNWFVAFEEIYFQFSVCSSIVCVQHA